MVAAEAARSVDRATVDDALSAVVRAEAGRLTVSIVRMVGDVGVAEEIVGDTLVVALERWRRDGLPANPAAWLALTARRRAIDRRRRDGRLGLKVAELERDTSAARAEVDDRLRLIFTCCHPALGPEARIALTLQAVLGFTIADIAAAFLTSEDAVAKRLSRARRKISEGGIPYRIPRDDELAERLGSVLSVLELAFNEGDLASRGPIPQRRDLAEDAAWLSGLLVELLPGEPEPLGLLALMRLNLARAAGRVDDRGRLVLLRDQDRSSWDRPAIGAAIALIERAAAFRRPGPYQLRAAIAASHATAATWSDTDWVEILVLYDRLLELVPSPVHRLNRAVAVAEVLGPDVALDEVDATGTQLARYHLFHATRGYLLRMMGRASEARSAEKRALALTENDAERALLEGRLHWSGGR